MINLDDYDAPMRPDFRRIGKDKIPYVMGLNGKRQRYGRSSNSGKILDDESNLTKWKLRTVIAGAAQRPELMAEASVLDIDLDKGKLSEIAEKCIEAGKGQRRAIIGNAVHAMFDHLDRDDGWKPPPNFAELCKAYTQMKSDWGLEPIGIEVHCINDEFRVAGTLDRRYKTTKTLIAPDGQVIPIGTVLIGDTKTGKELEYAAGSYCTQLAAYVDSMHYDVVTDERSKFDPPNFPDWGLIIHADSAGTEIDIYWVDIRQGREGLGLASSVKDWRRRSTLLMRAVEPSSVELPAVELPESPVEPPESPVEPPRVASRAEYLRGRVRAVIEHSELARNQLQRQWPNGIAGLKFPGHTWEQLNEIEKVVERVETDNSIPFYESWNDPIIKSMMNHPSNTARLIPRLHKHPRMGLINSWLNSCDISRNGELMHHITTVLLAFADFDESFTDDDVTTCLLGAMRGINGGNLETLDALTLNECAELMALAVGLGDGSAVLMFDDAGNAIVRMIYNEKGE